MRWLGDTPVNGWLERQVYLAFLLWQFKTPPLILDGTENFSGRTVKQVRRTQFLLLDDLFEEKMIGPCLFVED